MKRLIREDYERRNEIVEKAIEVIEDNADNEIIETGWIMDSDWRNASSIKDIIYSCNFNAPVAFSSGNYYGNATRKAVEEMVSELDNADDIIDLYNQEIQMGNGYRWSVNFKFDYGEYPDYPEDGYVLYAEFIDGNDNKHISDNTAFITMNDDENAIEKKVSRFMNDLKFSDKDKLKEFKTIKEAAKIPSSAKKKGNDLIKGIEELYRISETKPTDWLMMYDENDWSFLIKDFKFNEKSMMFTWKEKKDSTRADNSVSNEKEKFINNGEFDLYGEYNDFVNYWNKLVRKTKKYYEMDSTELDRKLGYDVDDDELEESKKVVKENYDTPDFESKEFFNEFKNYVYLSKYEGTWNFDIKKLVSFIGDINRDYADEDIAESIIDTWIEFGWIKPVWKNTYEFTVKRIVKESKKIVKENNYDVKIISTLKNDRTIFKEIAFAGVGTWDEAKEFADNNSEGWKLPDEKDALIMKDLYGEELQKMTESLNYYNFWINKESGRNSAYNMDHNGLFDDNDKAIKLDIFYIR